jgi:hypothetical protein
MKIIRNFLEYDTDKSTKVAIINNSATLYKTDNNNWFSYEDITNDFNALTEKEVVGILEEYGRYDTIKQYLGHLIKDA